MQEILGEIHGSFHEAGITVIGFVPSVALAKRMEKLGADAVIAEEWKQEGILVIDDHDPSSSSGWSCLYSSCGAGGVADGAGAAAVFMLGKMLLFQ